MLSDEDRDEAKYMMIVWLLLLIGFAGYVLQSLVVTGTAVSFAFLLVSIAFQIRLNNRNVAMQ